jgi:hypothetical protein
MSEPKTSVRRLHAIERQRRALELRKAGASFDEISSTLGYRGKSGAYQAVISALRRTLQEPADEVRKLELTRLDRAQRAAWERMIHGDLDALGKVLKIMRDLQFGERVTTREEALRRLPGLVKGQQPAQGSTPPGAASREGAAENPDLGDHGLG